MSLKNLWIIFLLFVVVAVGVFIFFIHQSRTELDEFSGNLGNAGVQERFAGIYATDFTRSSIDLDLLLSGGVGKNGIPALTDPKFVSANFSSVDEETVGVLLVSGNEVKFYPYSILVWHEIVNDEINGQRVAVTFCPLCGSAVVFDPKVAGDDKEFKVSGLLYQSNLVMYDVGSESFWSQSTGKSIAGKYDERQLDLYPFQLLSFSEVKTKYPGVMVLSENTGFTRDYQRNPYAGYENSNDLFFPVSNENDSYPAKEIFYIVRRGAGTVAIRKQAIETNNTYTNEELQLIVANDGGEIEVTDTDGKLIPGYYEMWFSWINQNPENAELWDPSI